MISAERTHSHSHSHPLGSTSAGGSPPGGDGGIADRFLSQRTPVDALRGADDAGASSGGAGGGTHDIVWGDTLSDLAVRYGTTVEALAEANGIANPDLIYAGDTLRLPPGAGDGGGAGGVGGVGGVGSVSGGTVDASDAQVQAVVDAMPADLRAANPDAAVHVARILEESRAQGLSPEQTAYVLASATHESGMGLYMEEIASGAAYEGRSDLGNTQAGDGVRFKGRGYVQITGRANYADWSSRLGVDLVANPELAEDPAIAAKILVGGMKDGTFTGRSLDDFIGGGRTDYVGARAIVNGSDKAALFAGAAENYAAALASVPASSSGAAPGGGANGSSTLTLADVGPEGSGSAIEFWGGGSEPVNLSAARPELVAMLGPIADAYAAGGDTAPPLITSANDKGHSHGSLHYSNLALDLATNHLPDAQAIAIADDLQARLGPDYDVIFEGTHIHAEYDPKA